MATWNVHGAIGIDFRRSVDRVADVLSTLSVDVALLQELDVGRPRSRGEDQPTALAVRLGLGHVFSAAMAHGEASYGNAILARCPLEAPETHVLPASPGAEPRAITRAIAATALGPIEIAVTHLGLLAGDRARQVDTILARLGPVRGLRILGGDLNDGPRSDVVRRLAEDALFRVGSPPTYPAALPLLRLDHLLVDHRLRVVGVHRPGLRQIRGASDHLPIVVTLETA